MKCKYKKFLKAAYIDYEEDYCSNAVLRSSRPPLSEILAPATFEITLSPGEGYYWTTFYTSMANYLAPEGVTVYKEHLEGRSITPSTVDDRIINKGQGVVIRSSTNTITLTKTYSRSSDDYSDNSLIGTDYLITNPGHAYALGYKDSAGVAFYRLSSTGKIKANKAYLIIEDIYLTQWRLVGNSTVHTDEYLTQWKVSGNSVVDNNAILSCGDLGQDGKYHVKISNGVSIYDIPLTEPLRKVNDVADSIEFVNGVATLTRKCGYVDLGTLDWAGFSNNRFRAYFESPLRPGPNDVCQILNTGGYTSVAGSSINTSATQDKTIAYVTLFVAETGYGFVIRNESFINAQDAKQKLTGIYAVYELDTPTTETIQVSPFPISPTDTYTSANDTPYSAFEYKKNVEIWSCGEYSEVDGKYHILVQPLGGSIADIALDEPLRKVNDVADSIEFADGVTTLTRAFDNVILSNLSWRNDDIYSSGKYRFTTASLVSVIKKTSGYANILTPLYDVAIADNVYAGRAQGISVAASGSIFVYDVNYNQADSLNAFLEHIQGAELIYELATPTTETIQVPQIAEADSYSCVISQGAKAVEWSSFETE